MFEQDYIVRAIRQFAAALVHGAKPYFIKGFCLLDELSEANVLPTEHEETLSWLVQRFD